MSLKKLLGIRGNETGRANGLPGNWPAPTPEDMAALPNRVVKVGQEQEYYFSDNFVKTSKYEVYNFLPKFLMEEFNPKQKMANVYFLIVACLQMVPQITNTFGIPTTLMPLTFVVVVDAVFAILEDMARHRADQAANSSVTRRLNRETNTFEECAWYELQVGDCVKVLTREVIPADLLIIATSEPEPVPQGMCYIETKSLDGETNLKLRNAMRNTLNIVRDEADLARLQGEIIMEHPNKLIESFTGTLDAGDHGKEPIQPHNVLLRGCSLRNTDYVMGIVLNTGHDTKIMMGSTETPSKASGLERRSSEEIRRIVALLLLVCTVGATGMTIWNDTYVSDLVYLDWNPNSGVEWVIQFFYFFLLHATFIPVSLYVSMSIARFFQSYFMDLDLDMYHSDTDTPARVRTMTLNEELGQISHIFSDKTGTLTCNIMDFRKCSIEGIAYGRGVTEIGKAALALEGKQPSAEDAEANQKAAAMNIPHVTFYDPAMTDALNGKRGPGHRAKILQFFQTLGVCHSVIPEKVDGEIQLSASSPDDEALVSAAAYFGYAFKDRQEGCAILDERGQTVKYDVLELLDFTSARKRMSVIVRMPDGQIQLMSKGADSIMLPRLRPGQEEMIATTEAHMYDYAMEGLRCLVVGYNNLTEAEFNAWYAKYRAAVTDIEQIERRKDGLPNKIDDLMDEIEQNLHLLGATAIEDKLQDGVPECIAELARAGINIWVLTGDKEETAINISIACNLVKPVEYMKRIVVNRSTCATAEEMLALFQREIQELEDEGPSAKERALVIDGSSLISAFDDSICPTFLDLGKRCKAVVACRVSPDQKRHMVQLVKETVPGVRTLAIGDGANDVAMIQAAHVGVGISGQEGMQAVNASDYAIAQFRYLKILLLAHGRWNYRRMCKLICYMFYKNILMSIAQFWFASYNGFSGQKIYTEAGIQLYNLVFTSLPILMLGIYDQDVTKEFALTNPELYIPCIKDYFFRPALFWRWMLAAMAESVVLLVIPLYAVENADPQDGVINTFWEYGAITFTAILFVVNFKMFLIQNQWTWVHFVILILSVLSWFGVAAIVNANLWIDFEWYDVFNQMANNPNAWLCIFLIIVIINGKDLYVKGVTRNYFPQAHHIIQEWQKGFSNASVGYNNGQQSRSMSIEVSYLPVVNK